MLLFFITLSAYSKEQIFDYNKYISNIPTYPKAVVYDLEKETKIKMRVHLIEDSFEKVTQFYINEMTQKGWFIEFPDKLEYKIWMEALNKDKSKKPNIMIGMIDPKTKINCNLSIGVVKDARLTKEVTIVSIYLTNTMLR
ncbi:MAG: hypothetical protein U0354_15150 [Candidatus Sericytochromatia bacterium]